MKSGKNRDGMMNGVPLFIIFAKEGMMLRYWVLTILLCVILFVTSCALRHQASQLRPLPEEQARTLQPGLQPRYFAKFMARDVRELPDDTGSQLKTWLGEPITVIDHQFGDGEVFGSGLSRGVGVRMRGAIRLPARGTYTFQAVSNDGIEMFLGDLLVLSDPLQHSDQLSKEGSVEIPAEGWYPVRIDYFQRKGTATLQLFWTTPRGTRTTIPAEAYGHLP